MIRHDSQVSYISGPWGSLEWVHLPGINEIRLYLFPIKGEPWTWKPAGYWKTKIWKVKSWAE